MIDWSFSSEVQILYENVIAQNKKMQAGLGIEPKTIEQRHQEYLIRKAEELRRGQELAQLKLRMKHPPLRRKV